MKEVEIQLILKSFKNNFLLRKILSFFCYFLIIFSLSFYLSNFFKKKQVVRIVSQLNASEQTINAEKIMINPRITIKHDDGKTFAELDKADIVLVGISRTSKTPLSIFLSHKGWKVANVPLVLDTPLPEELFKIDQRRVVGLIIDMDSLQRIRKSRLEKFGQDPGGSYASMQHISNEIEYAEKIFKQNRRWPVFNVTERALEETASEIVRIIAARLGLPDSVIF
jgi:regulator of PEP synthase PpsR (kinase-PPPase family)